MGHPALAAPGKKQVHRFAQDDKGEGVGIHAQECAHHTVGEL